MNAHTKPIADKMAVSAALLANQVAFVRVNPGNTFAVSLKCGGPTGYGDTFEEALADALARNADWLGEAA